MKRGIIISLLLVLIVLFIFGCGTERSGQDKNRGSSDQGINKLDAVSIAKTAPGVNEILEIYTPNTANAELGDGWKVEFDSEGKILATVMIDKSSGEIMDVSVIDKPEGYCRSDADCIGEEKCSNNRCAEIFVEPMLEDPLGDMGEECELNSDCVPDACCHATGCVREGEAPKCDQALCTLECAPGTLDCGGQCVCAHGYCRAVLNTLQ